MPFGLQKVGGDPVSRPNPALPSAVTLGYPRLLGPMYPGCSMLLSPAGVPQKCGSIRPIDAVMRVNISSNHQRNLTFPRYQSMRWKHKIKCSVVEVLKHSKHSSRCRGSTNASTRGAVSSSHQCGSGLYTPPGSTSVPYRSNSRSAVIHLII